MDKLHLALLTKWAEDAGLPGIQGRKRMQKVIYFLKQAGCPIDVDYTLHHYGPYSREVANVADVMVAEGLLIEQGAVGSHYDYRLGDQTRQMIDQAQAVRTESIQKFEAFKEQAVRLLRADIWHLELGSTILYFYRSSRATADWETAMQEACMYKKTDPKRRNSQDALVLAKQFVAAAN